MKAAVTSASASVDCTCVGYDIRYSGVGVRLAGGLPRPHGALLLGASLRFVPELDPSSHIRPWTYAATLSLCSPFFVHTMSSLSHSRLIHVTGAMATDDGYLSRHACSRLNLTARRPKYTDKHRKRYARMPPRLSTMCVHAPPPHIVVSWASIQSFPLVSPNTRADFAANQHQDASRASRAAPLARHAT